jgi:small nuclear ribonucleoprotein (snRNP)-like protein
MLENSVTPVSELRQLKNNSELEQTKTGRTLAYDGYLNLLLSTATTYDNQFACKKPKPNAFMHSLCDHFSSSDVSYNIDA